MKRSLEIQAPPQHSYCGKHSSSWLKLNTEEMGSTLDMGHYDTNGGHVLKRLEPICPKSRADPHLAASQWSASETSTVVCASNAARTAQAAGACLS